jgi:alkylhydroperoxidase/carboxymuconolactone decarboxylase family protein YurZ
VFHTAAGVQQSNVAKNPARSFPGLAVRSTYLKATWDFIRRTLESDLLSAEQKRLVAFAVSAAAGSDYGIDLFTRDARRPRRVR